MGHECGIMVWIPFNNSEEPKHQPLFLWGTEAEIETCSISGSLSSRGHALLGCWARPGAVAGSYLLGPPLHPPDGQSCLFTCEGPYGIIFGLDDRAAIN